MKAYVQTLQPRTTIELRAPYGKPEIELDQLIRSEIAALEALRKFQDRFSDEISKREKFIDLLKCELKSYT